MNLKRFRIIFVLAILNIFGDHVESESVKFALFGLKYVNSKSGNYSAVLMSSGSGGSASRCVVSFTCGLFDDETTVDLLPKSSKILNFEVKY